MLNIDEEVGNLEYLNTMGLMPVQNRINSISANTDLYSTSTLNSSTLFSDQYRPSTLASGDNNAGIYITRKVSLANASSSIKKPNLTSIRGVQFKNQSGTAADIIYLAFGQTATATNGITIYGGQTFETNFPTDFRGKISMIAAQGTPTLTGVIWGTTGA